MALLRKRFIFVHINTITKYMTTQTIYHLALITHLTGLIMVAGTTLVDYAVTRQFWIQHAIDKSNSLAIRGVLSKLPIVFGVGFIFLIVSGVYMMYVTHGAFGEQVWFRIKFALIILIIVNGVAFGRRQGSKLRKVLSEGIPGSNSEERLLKIKSNLNLFHLSQLLFFLTILTLSVFKFN
jgi:hypothetical protein